MSLTGGYFFSFFFSFERCNQLTSLISYFKNIFRDKKDQRKFKIKRTKTGEDQRDSCNIFNRVLREYFGRINYLELFFLERGTFNVLYLNISCIIVMCFELFEMLVAVKFIMEEGLMGCFFPLRIINN